MQYFVTMTVSTPIEPASKNHPVRYNETSTHIPAFSREDAEGMCTLMERDLLSSSGNHWEEHKQTRGFEITCRVWTRKGSVYLSLSEVEMIASEYTNIFKLPKST